MIGVETWDLFNPIHSFDYVQEPLAPSPKELVFYAKNIPPMGINLYYIEKVSSTPLEANNDSVTYFGTKVKLVS